VPDAATPPGGTEVTDPPRDPWRPADIARLLAGVTVPWYVVGRAKRASEPRNQADFGATAGLLSDDAAGRLSWALRRVHPGHAWFGAVARARGGQTS
jgi:hypothetical protein